MLIAQGSANRPFAIFLFQRGDDAVEVIAVAHENGRHGAGLRGKGIDQGKVVVEKLFSAAQCRKTAATGDNHPARIALYRLRQGGGKLRADHFGRFFQGRCIGLDHVQHLLVRLLQLLDRPIFNLGAEPADHVGPGAAKDGEHGNEKQQVEFGRYREMLESSHGRFPFPVGNLKFMRSDEPVIIRTG